MPCGMDCLPCVRFGLFDNRFRHILLSLVIKRLFAALPELRLCLFSFPGLVLTYFSCNIKMLRTPPLFLNSQFPLAMPSSQGGLVSPGKQNKAEPQHCHHRCDPHT